jgi:hypothetical protein
MAKKKRKKKKPSDAIEPKGKMRPEGAAGSGNDGTRVDDGARHIFFSFKGELKSDLPEGTDTDLAGNLSFPLPEQTDTSEPQDESVEASESEPEAAPPQDAEAEATAADTQIEHEPAQPAAPDRDQNEQSRAGPVRGPDPAAQKNPASQSRKAAGPAHFIPPAESPLGDSKPEEPAVAPQGAKAGAPQIPEARPPQKPKAEAPQSGPPEPAEASTEPATHTDVRGEPFAPISADATHTEIDAGLFAPRPDPTEEVDADAPTETELEARVEPTPPKPVPPRPGKVASVGDEPTPKSETILDASIFRAAKPREDLAAGDTTVDVPDVAKTPKDEAAAAGDVTVDAPEVARAPTAVPKAIPKAAPKAPAAPRDETLGSETVLDSGMSARAPKGDAAAAGDVTVDAPEAARAPAAVPKANPKAVPKAPAAARDETLGSQTIHDAEGAPGAAPTVTHPDASTRTGPVATPREADPDAETLTKDPFATATGPKPTAAAADREEAPADPAVSFHDAETASQDLAPIAEEAALPALSPFDLPLDDQTQSLTEPKPEIPTVEVPRTPFAGPLFDAPAPAVSDAPEQPEGPRLRRRRRGARKPAVPAVRRLVRWAKQHLDPRDFLEIVGKAAFEHAQKVGEKLRTARRENRVSHTAEWWRKTLVEIAILYAIVIPVELAVSGGRIGSFGIHPHPYWLIVLPIAAARGLVAGLVTAAIASLLYTIGAAQSVADALFTFKNMTEPLLFFAVAFFTGELHDEGLLKRKKLDRRIQDLEERTGQLRQQRDVLTDANRELEKRIVDDSVQFGNLIQAARRIERAGRQEVFDLALEMVEEHCGAAASVLLILEDGSIDYLCHLGWPSEEIGKRLAITRASPFVERAIREGTAVNGIDPSEVAPPEGPLVVAPLFDAQGVVRALMCMDEIPLARLNESTVTVFLGIADWASAALGRLTRGGDAPAARAAAFSVGPEVDLWLGTVAELGKRLRIELSRNSRYGVPTSFLTVQATDWKDATREGIDALDRFILMHFTTGLRPSDGIYRFGYPGAYLLVLAGTSLKGAEVVRTRLERRISYTPSAFGAVEILATGPDTEAPDLPSLINRIARKFRENSPLPLDSRTPVTIPGHVEAEDLNAFLRRLKMETSLSVRNNFDLHVVGISAEGSEAAGPGALARHVVEVGEQTLRPTDGVYMIGQYQCAVILPCTNGEEAATVAHRLATLVRARDPSAPYGQIETQVLGLGPSHPDAGSFLTALARRGKETTR